MEQSRTRRHEQKGIGMDSEWLNHLYELVLQQLRDGIILSDAEGKMVFVNDAANRFATCGAKISSAKAWSTATVRSPEKRCFARWII